MSRKACPSSRVISYLTIFQLQKDQQKILFPPYQYYYHQTQLNSNKEKILSMLVQVGVDISQLQHLTVPELLKISENHLKKSYSVKVLGVKDGEIGVLSKRIEMRNQKNHKKSKDNSTLPQLISPEKYPKHLITNYFYPKSLKATKKPIDQKYELFREKLLMWQAQQYEKIKGSKDLSFRIQEDQPLSSSRSQNTQPIFVTNDALPSKNLTLPSVKRQKIGQYRSKIHHQENSKVKEFPIPQNNCEKPSYSRLLSNLNEADIDLAKSQVLKIENRVSYQTPPKLSPKAGGVIYELEEEENESHPRSKLNLPPITKKTFDFSPDQILTKRLKKIQVKFNEYENTE